MIKVTLQNYILLRCTVAFNTYTELYNHHHYPISETFQHPKETSYLVSITTHSLSTQPLQPLSYFLSLPIFLFWLCHIIESYKMSPFVTASFTLIMFSKFIHFVACISFAFLFMAEQYHCMDILTFAYPFVSWKLEVSTFWLL